jgi:hypothetical protein
MELPKEESRPPSWIIDYAERLCGLWSGTPVIDSAREEVHGSVLGVEETLNSRRRYNPFENDKRLRLPYLIVPMEDSNWDKSAETLKAYKRRARQALMSYFKRIQAPSRPKRISALPERKTAGHDLDHYEWVILRRCCGFTLRKIMNRYSAASENVIWEGIHHKEYLLSLAPLNR